MRVHHSFGRESSDKSGNIIFKHWTRNSAFTFCFNYYHSTLASLLILLTFHIVSGEMHAVKETISGCCSVIYDASNGKLNVRTEWRLRRMTRIASISSMKLLIAHVRSTKSCVFSFPNSSHVSRKIQTNTTFMLRRRIKIFTIKNKTQRHIKYGNIQTSSIEWPYTNSDFDFIRCHVYVDFSNELCVNEMWWWWWCVFHYFVWILLILFLFFSLLFSKKKINIIQSGYRCNARIIIYS